MAEQLPTAADLNTMQGAFLSAAHLWLYDIGTSPHWEDNFKALWQIAQALVATTELQVFKDDTTELDFGVRAGKCTLAGNTVTYAGAVAQTLDDDATTSIYLDADGTLVKSITGFPTTPHMPLAAIATGTESADGVSGYYDFDDMTDERGRAMFAMLAPSSAAQTATNNSGAGMDQGDLVYITNFDTPDGNPEILLADADDPANQATHVLLADIADEAAGSIAPYARVVVDTTGRSVGEAVYLSTAAGEWTQTAPTGIGQFSQRVGIVETVGAGGTLMFFPGLGLVGKIGAASLQDGLADLVTTVSVTFGAEVVDVISVYAQVKDAAGNDLAAKFLVRMWVSEIDFGAPSDTGHTAWPEGGVQRVIQANADFELLSDASGKAALAVMLVGSGSRYVMAEIDGRIYSSGEITWTA